jgi:glycosyltransferase involved in cell wall biosynthesis
MKILSVHISTPENNAEYWRISNIARILEENGHEVDLAHYCGKKKYAQFRGKDEFPQDKFVVSSSIGIFFKHLNILREQKYDLVYANTGAAAFCSFLGKLTKVPLVFDMHGDYLQELLLNHKFSLNPHFLGEFLRFKTMEFANLRSADEIICVSNRMIKFLHHNKGIPLEKMAYVTNGVDLQFFSPKKDNTNLKERLELEDKFILGYVGGTQSWQGLENLIKSMNHIQDPEIAFILVGGTENSYGGMEKSNNIQFIPEINRMEIPDYYSICDVLILPRPFHIATEIAAPTKFAEYTAMGKPILTTDVGDAADLVKKYKCGFVVEKNQVDSLIDGINKFKNLNTEELKKMGENSRRLAEKEFDWNLVADNLLNALKRFQ